MKEQLGEACSGDTGPERRREGWSPGRSGCSWVCEYARACAPTLVKEGLHSGQCSPGASAPPAPRPPKSATSLTTQPSPASHPGEVFWCFLGHAFPSIRISLHSCESFSKQTQRGRGGSQRGEGGWMQTWPYLLPLPALPFSCILGAPSRRALE